MVVTLLGENIPPFDAAPPSPEPSNNDYTECGDFSSLWPQLILAGMNWGTIDMGYQNMNW